MRITNKTQKRILCYVDGIEYVLEDMQTIEIEDFIQIRFIHEKNSHSVADSEKSKILKILSFFDDPFGVNKEFHISVEYLLKREQVHQPQEIAILSSSCYADTITRTFYNYFIVCVDGIYINPKKIAASGREHIKNDFYINNKRLIKWDIIWNVVIESLLLEIIGYYAIYRLSSIWVGKKAWLVVMAFVIPTLLIEFVISFHRYKKNKKIVYQFEELLQEESIYRHCYENTDN